ncbi:MAG: ABC transporter substrate-binding protein [Pseudomonadota bacterium]
MRTDQLKLLHNAHSIIAFAVAILFLLLLQAHGTNAQSSASEVPADEQTPVSIALMLEKSSWQCQDEDVTDAIKALALKQQAKINSEGGIKGRRFRVDFVDLQSDWRDEEKYEQNLRKIGEVLDDPGLLGVVGLQGSGASRNVLTKYAEKITNDNIPFLIHTSDSSVFKELPSVFSTLSAQEAENVPVIANAIANKGISRVAFLGRSGSNYIQEIANGLEQNVTIKDKIISFNWVKRAGRSRDAGLNEAELDSAIATMRTQDLGLVIVAVGASLSRDVVTKFKEAKFTPPIMFIGSLSLISNEVPEIYAKDYYPQPIYLIDRNTVPDVEQDTLTSLVPRSSRIGSELKYWLPEEAERLKQHGWKNGDCLRYGGRFADMIDLVAEAAGAKGYGIVNEKPVGGLPVMRTAVLEALGSTYAAGRGVFYGRFENWSFLPEFRVRTESPLVIIFPQNLGRAQLDPVQFVRTRKGTLNRIDTLYLDVDIQRIYSIDDNSRSFYADFYLSMRGSDVVNVRNMLDRIKLDGIKFTNAFIDPRTNGPQLTIEPIYTGENPSDAYPQDMRIYSISGRFRFNSDFSNYPFDKQQFSIDIEPNSGDKLFIIQPPPLELRDKKIHVNNWEHRRQFVSYTDQFLPVVDAFTHTPSIVPFYQSRFVWELQREVKDYYVQVAVPLALILIVAYLSIFIPQSHLEAIITLQVTALLAAVALYLSLPQIDSDTATISDRIFMLDYMMVAVMILISILRINLRGDEPELANGVSNGVKAAEKSQRTWRSIRWSWVVDMTLFLVHVVIIPVFVVVVLVLISRSLPAETINEIVSWEQWKRTLLGIGS